MRFKIGDRGIAGNAIGALANFRNTTFTENQKSEILSLLNEESPHFNEFVKLIGFLQIEGAQARLKNLLAVKKVIP